MLDTMLRAAMSCMCEEAIRIAQTITTLSRLYWREGITQPLGAYFETVFQQANAVRVPNIAFLCFLSRSHRGTASISCINTERTRSMLAAKEMRLACDRSIWWAC